MEISGMRARRDAYGAQDFAATVARGTAETGGVRALHLARAVSADTAAAADAASQIAHARANASVQLSQAFRPVVTGSGELLQNVRTRHRADGVHIDAASRAKTRMNILLAKIASHFSRLDEKTGQKATNVPRFANLWSNRKSDQVAYGLVSEYAFLKQSQTDVSFLRAVDALQAHPSITGARQLLQTYIEPLPVDDFGIEIEVPGKSVLNMSSDTERKVLMATANAAISKAELSGDPEDVKILCQLFDGAARQAASLVSNNLGALAGDLRRWKDEQASA